jgi:hypothetical protein
MIAPECISDVQQSNCNHARASSDDCSRLFERIRKGGPRDFWQASPYFSA